MSTGSAGRAEKPGPEQGPGGEGLSHPGATFYTSRRCCLALPLRTSDFHLGQQLPSFGIGRLGDSGELVMTHSNVGEQCLSPGPLSSPCSEPVEKIQDEMERHPLSSLVILKGRFSCSNWLSTRTHVRGFWSHMHSASLVPLPRL